MHKTTIIVLHYKNIQDTRECIDSLLLNKSLNIHQYLYVVSNSIENHFKSKLEDKYADLKVINSHTNLGFAGGVNLGLEKAIENESDYIVLLNNDTIVTKDLISKLVTFANSDESIGIVSPKIYFASGFEFHLSRYNKNERGKIIWYAGGEIDQQNIYPKHRGLDEVDHGQFDQTREVDFATGCCMLLNAKIMKKVGYFDEKYFLYFEDVDYSYRVKNKGFKVVYDPHAHLWHKNASSSGKPGSDMHIYYQTRNRLYFGYKYADISVKKALLAESLKMIFKGGIRSKAVIDYYLGRMGERRS